MWDMKLAVIPLPNERSCEFVMKKSEVPPRIIFISPRGQGVVMVGLLLVLVAVAYGYFTMVHSSPAAARSAAATSAKQFDGKRRLVPGELVVLNDGNPLQVQKVAAAPKQAVLVRQGDKLRGIYMGGERRYVVLSGTETRIVSADQVRAVVASRGEH